MQILYFAWVRERIGKNSEHVTLPDGVKTVSDLADWLGTQGDNYKNALNDRSRLRVALNQVFVGWHEGVSDNDEVAFFPPVTGG